MHAIILIMKEKVLLYTYANPLTPTNNNRLKRIAMTLADKKFNRVVVLTGKGENDEYCFPDSYRDKIFIKRVNIFHTPVEKQTPLRSAIMAVAWLISLSFWAMSHRVDCVNMVGFAELVTVPFFKWIKGAKVVYFADDIMTENRLNKVLSFISGVFEGIFLRLCDCVIAVSQESADWYQKRYNLSTMSVVWNAFITADEVNSNEKIDLRAKFDIAKNNIIYGYIGTFITGRNLETLLRVFADAEPDKHLVLGGYGQLEQLIEVAAKKHDNIHYFGAVSWDELPAFINGIDIGVILFEDVSLNHRYTLTTKFFEYLAMKKPVLASDFNGMRKIVQKYSCGWYIAPVKQSIEKVVNEINRDQLDIYTENLQGNNKFALWDNQVDNLIGLYD